MCPRQGRHAEGRHAAVRLVHGLGLLLKWVAARSPQDDVKRLSGLAINVDDVPRLPQPRLASHLIASMYLRRGIVRLADVHAHGGPTRRCVPVESRQGHSRAFESTRGRKTEANSFRTASTSASLATPRDRSENPGVGGSIPSLPTRVFTGLGALVLTTSRMASDSHEYSDRLILSSPWSKPLSRDSPLSF